MILNFRDKRIVYLKNEKNVGACVTRNRGITKAKGKFVICVDDELLPRCIEKRIEGFSEEKIGLVYSECIYVDEIKKENLKVNKKK